MSRIKSKHVMLEAEGQGWKQVLIVETDLPLDATHPHYDKDAVADLMREAGLTADAGGFQGCRIVTTRRPARREPLR